MQDTLQNNTAHKQVKLEHQLDDDEIRYVVIKAAMLLMLIIILVTYQETQLIHMNFSGTLNLSIEIICTYRYSSWLCAYDITMSTLP